MSGQPRTAIERLLDLLPGTLGDDREIQAAAEAIEVQVANPDAAGRREAIEYAAAAAHHGWWDSANQGGHSDPDWRKCSEWPCTILADPKKGPK